MRIDDPINRPEEIFIGGRILNGHWCTAHLTVIDDHVDGVLEKQLAFAGRRHRGRGAGRGLEAAFFEQVEMRQHVLLYGLEIALHAFLEMALLEFGNQRGDEQGAKIALHLADVGRQLLHELPLPQHHGAKLLHDLILTALQILALLLTEVFELFWRHGTIAL